jgi:phosphomannomutase
MTEKYKKRRYHYHRRSENDFANEWVHLRKSNRTYYRIYTEAPSQAQADTLALPIESKAVAGI